MYVEHFKKHCVKTEIEFSRQFTSIISVAIKLQIISIFGFNTVTGAKYVLKSANNNDKKKAKSINKNRRTKKAMLIQWTAIEYDDASGKKGGKIQYIRYRKKTSLSMLML